jgi:RimJ/RimL family protein N-acetyltransferase
MQSAAITLRPLTHAELPVLQPWFEDPDTSRFLGGADWPAKMLDNVARCVGETFRGAVQEDSHHYLALADGTPVGYIDCGTFDRCTIYGGEGPDGPITLATIEARTGAIAFTIDPNRRRQGLATRMIGALTQHPDLATVKLFEAGVEPDNEASRRTLDVVGFRPRSAQPDCEGMLYYLAWHNELGSPSP